MPYGKCRTRALRRSLNPSTGGAPRRKHLDALDQRVDVVEEPTAEGGARVSEVVVVGVF